MKLKLLPQKFGILKLKPTEAIPSWAVSSDYFFIAKTNDELSILCPQQDIPNDRSYSANWRCFRVDGDLEFDAVGIVARVSKPLADDGMSLFLVSTHDRDYVFVAQDDLQRAIERYQSVNFSILDS